MPMVKARNYGNLLVVIPLATAHSPIGVGGFANWSRAIARQLQLNLRPMRMNLWNISGRVHASDFRLDLADINRDERPVLVGANDVTEQALHDLHPCAAVPFDAQDHELQALLANALALVF